MTQIKKQYYIKGVDNQKKPDMTFELKRVDISKLISLENADKFRLIDFLRECQNDIQLTIDRLQP
jgi:hypothetical protein